MAKDGRREKKMKPNRAIPTGCHSEGVPLRFSGTTKNLTKEAQTLHNILMNRDMGESMKRRDGFPDRSR